MTEEPGTFRRFIVSELRATGQLLLPTVLFAGLFAALFPIITEYPCALLDCGAWAGSRGVRWGAIVVLVLALGPLMRLWHTRRRASLVVLALGYLAALGFYLGVMRGVIPRP